MDMSWTLVNKQSLQAYRRRQRRPERCSSGLSSDAKFSLGALGAALAGPGRRAAAPLPCLSPAPELRTRPQRALPTLAPAESAPGR